MFTLSFINTSNQIEELPEYINVSGSAFNDLSYAEEFLAAAQGEYVKTTFFDGNEGYINTKMETEGPCLIKFSSYTNSNYEPINETMWEWRISAGAGDSIRFYKLSDNLFDESPWRKNNGNNTVDVENDPVVNITIVKVE